MCLCFGSETHTHSGWFVLTAYACAVEGEWREEHVYWKEWSRVVWRGGREGSKGGRRRWRKLGLRERVGGGRGIREGKEDRGKELVLSDLRGKISRGREVGRDTQRVTTY